MLYMYKQIYYIDRKPYIFAQTIKTVKRLLALVKLSAKLQHCLKFF